MRTGWCRIAAVPLVALLVVAGCGDDDGEETADVTEGDTTETTEAEPEVQQVSFSGSDYTFDGAPEEVEAGAIEITFENTGEVPHEAQMATIGDTPVQTFADDFGAVLEGGPVPEYVEEITGVGEVEAGGTLTETFTVTEGNYVWFCALDADADAPPPAEGEEPPPGEPHFNRGMIQAVTVVEGEADAALPEADGTITAKDYSFEVDVQAGEAQTINFVNEGPDELHHAVLFPFVEGTDVAAAEAAIDAFVAGGEEAPPPPEIDLAAAEGPEAPGDSAVYSGGLGGTFEVNLISGRTYGVVCFISDRTGGPPHVVANDMSEVFTVQ